MNREAGAAEAARSGAAWPDGGLEAVGACPVCGSPERRVLYAGLTDRLFGAPGEWTLWRCGACPTAYLDPRPTAETVGLAYADYFWHRPPEDREGPPANRVEWARRALRNGYLHRALGYEAEPSSRALGALASVLPGAPAALRRWVRHLPAGGRLLDVGCASGEFMLQMRSLGWEVHGMDIDDASLEQARAAGLSVAAGTLDAPAGAAAQGGFDAITLAHVIEHLPDPVGALRHARDLLRPGGLLWVATPNLRSLAHRMFRRDWLSLDPPRHLVLFSSASLVRAFEEAGLERIEQPAPVRNLGNVAAQSAELAGGAPPRAKVALAQEIAVRRPELAEELVVMGRRA
jgi:SAM-dependent methyltransferase